MYSLNVEVLELVIVDVEVLELRVELVIVDVWCVGGDEELGWSLSSRQISRSNKS